MSSEMRVTDAMVEAALDGLDNACMDIAKRELQPHDVLWRGFSRIRRMEAMRAALNAALLARTEAGAPHHPLAICPTCKDYYEVCECTPDAAPVAVPVKVPAPRYIDCPCCSSQEDHLHQCMPYFAAMQAKEAK